MMGLFFCSRRTIFVIVQLNGVVMVDTISKNAFWCLNFYAFFFVGVFKITIQCLSKEQILADSVGNLGTTNCLLRFGSMENEKTVFKGFLLKPCSF